MSPFKHRTDSDASNPLAELPQAAITRLAELLSRPPRHGVAKPSSEWLASQGEQIAALSSKLHLRRKNRSSLATFLSMDKHLRPKLCRAHAELSPELIHWVYGQLRWECTTHIHRIRCYRDRFGDSVRDPFGDECPEEIADFVNKTSGIASLLLPPAELDEHYGRHGPPSDCRLGPVENNCPACAVAVVGARAELLVYLRANMVARTKRTHPRLMVLIDAWIMCFGGENGPALMEDSDELAAELKRIRHAMSDRRSARKEREEEQKKEKKGKDSKKEKYKKAKTREERKREERKKKKEDEKKKEKKEEKKKEKEEKEKEKKEERKKEKKKEEKRQDSRHTAPREKVHAASKSSSHRAGGRYENLETTAPARIRQDAKRAESPRPPARTRRDAKEAAVPEPQDDPASDDDSSEDPASDDDSSEDQASDNDSSEEAASDDDSDDEAASSSDEPNSDVGPIREVGYPQQHYDDGAGPAYAHATPDRRQYQHQHVSPYQYENLAPTGRLSQVPVVNPYEYNDDDYTSKVSSSDDDDDDDNHGQSDGRRDQERQFGPFYAESAVPAPLNIKRNTGAGGDARSWITHTIASDIASTVHPRPASRNAPGVPAEYAPTQRQASHSRAGRDSKVSRSGSRASKKGSRPPQPLDHPAASAAYAASSVYSTDDHDDHRTVRAASTVSAASTVKGPARPVSPMSIRTGAGEYGSEDGHGRRAASYATSCSVSTFMPARRNWLAGGRFKDPSAELTPEDSASCVMERKGSETNEKSEKGEKREKKEKREKRTMTHGSGTDRSGLYREG